ncbi:uncharacterized protein CTRU02_215573 [Colletotrichum truncatum]|uniref:Uncharacterized protein n=1 Tax=Colletotrichum truncatum TaxID=5467 RepID=A0ACC3YC42_COLTU|nr:uncharacterized protein CTRU02_05494 [Colletotrichum truncatum]KAF6793937.1 hypothetical protein CTRU02_05494 [Colletotrichum truncatum]
MSGAVEINAQPCSKAFLDAFHADGQLPVVKPNGILFKFTFDGPDGPENQLCPLDRNLAGIPSELSINIGNPGPQGVNRSGCVFLAGLNGLSFPFRGQVGFAAAE